ncbi:hypothetical protein ACLB2K_031085 [Fragaria x ananassa]
MRALLSLAWRRQTLTLGYCSLRSLASEEVLPSHDTYLTLCSRACTPSIQEGLYGSIFWSGRHSVLLGGVQMKLDVVGLKNSCWKRLGFDSINVWDPGTQVVSGKRCPIRFTDPIGTVRWDFRRWYSWNLLCLSQTGSDGKLLDRQSDGRAFNLKREIRHGSVDFVVGYGMTSLR